MVCFKPKTLFVLNVQWGLFTPYPILHHPNKSFLPSSRKRDNGFICHHQAIPLVFGESSNKFGIDQVRLVCPKKWRCGQHFFESRKRLRRQVSLAIFQKYKTVISLGFEAGDFFGADKK